ncbi:MAG TPA: hypothetical protein VK759_04735 [Rhizomicrobium sp.]|nr:hypothetical protein [Rhizomicrobium sp.]
MNDTRTRRPHPRWRIVRDVALLQVKLLLGNLHNFMLMPLAVFAGAVDILFKNYREEALLYKVLAWGRHLDERIGLYNALENEEGKTHNPHEHYSVDAVVARVEAAIAHEFKTGEVTTNVKTAMRRVLDKLHRENREAEETPVAE